MCLQLKENKHKPHAETYTNINKKLAHPLKENVLKKMNNWDDLTITQFYVEP